VLFIKILYLSLVLLFLFSSSLLIFLLFLSLLAWLLLSSPALSSMLMRFLLRRREGKYTLVDCWFGWCGSCCCSCHLRRCWYSCCCLVVLVATSVIVVVVVRVVVNADTIPVKEKREKRYVGWLLIQLVWFLLLFLSSSPLMIFLLLSCYFYEEKIVAFSLDCRLKPEQHCYPLPPSNCWLSCSASIILDTVGKTLSFTSTPS